MDYGNNLDLTNVYIQDFEVMVDPRVILEETVFHHHFSFGDRSTSSEHSR